jgi:hypothetical protein
MRHKNQKPPICIGGSEKLRAMDRPRYMNVPSPAPCHVNVAGVGKQSVWGLRIIACSSSSLLHHSCNSSIAKVVTNLGFTDDSEVDGEKPFIESCRGSPSSLQCVICPVHVNAQRRSTLRRLVGDRWNSVIFLAKQVEQRAHAEFAQFGSSSNCGLQFANCGHGVPAHRSMCRKVASYQRQCSQEHDD